MDSASVNQGVVAVDVVNVKTSSGVTQLISVMVRCFINNGWDPWMYCFYQLEDIDSFVVNKR